MKTILWPRLNRYIPIWPTPKQAAFMALSDLEALFGGAAGGGKSVALLAAALMFADVPGYSALILRRSYRSFEQHGGLIELSKQWLSRTDATWNEATSTWRFPSGATLAFRHLHDVGHLQGSEYQFIGVDELAEVEEQDYLYLFARLRAKADSSVPCRMRVTCNPVGPGVEWVYQRFLIEGPSASLIFIPARFEDNPHLDQVGYRAALARLPWFLRGALQDGRWDIRPQGGLFLRSWFAGGTLEYPQLPADLTLCRFWDLAATKSRAGSDPDYTAGVLLGRDREGVFYVIDVVRAQASDLEVIELIARTAEADRRLAETKGWRAPMIRVEQEPGAASIYLIGEFRRRSLAGFDFRGVRPRGSKQDRARPLSAVAEAGELRLRRAPWNGTFLDELCAFPLGSHDDQVDALSGAYARLAEGERRGHVRIHRAIFGEPPSRIGRRRRFVDPPPPPHPWER
ncbi:MAG: phage terminase large subunit, partial [Actinomycetota bacterium]|nr:phage terminase large subunit [Actinomycetota bacterium]